MGSIQRSRPLKKRKCKKARNPEAGEVTRSFRDVELPDWFIIEVLYRLPVKSVSRCKGVSRNWLALASHPSFIPFYIPRALSLPQQPWTILSGTMHVKGITAFGISDHNKLLRDVFPDGLKSPGLHVLQVPHPHEPTDCDNYQIVAVSGGLMLYSLCVNVHARFYHLGRYYICNPVTKKWFSLPPPRRPFRMASTGFVTQVQGTTLTSFRVVRLDCFLGKSESLELEIFSSDAGEWTDVIAGCEELVQVAWRRAPVSFDGILHWFDRDLGLIAYDPYNAPNKCRVIAFPDEIRRQQGSKVGGEDGILNLCGVQGGRLRFFQVREGYRPNIPFFAGLSVWGLDDYASGKWDLQHRIGVTDIAFDRRRKALLTSTPSTFPIPVCFHPFDASAVYLGWDNFFVSYNMGTKKLEAVRGVRVKPEHEFEESTGWIQCRKVPRWWLSVPLLLPPWPTSIPPAFLPNH